MTRHAAQNPSTIVIANRAAAAGKVGRKWPTIDAALRRVIGDYEPHFTSERGHAATLAQDAVASGITSIISVGGDGTNHEVLCGIMAANVPPGSVTLGMIPFGTGGDFKRLLRRAKTIRQAVEELATPGDLVDVGHVRFIGDDGQPKERYFLNSTSFGLGGLVDKLVNETPKTFGGKASFYIATLRALMRYKATHVRLFIDDEDVGEHAIANVFVANGRYTGGGMTVAPDALLDDGLFDISLIPHMSMFKLVTRVGKLYDGSFRDLPEVHTWRGKKVEARRLDPAMGLLDVDGENPGGIPATLQLIPRAIRVRNLRSSVLSERVSLPTSRR